MKRVTLIVFLLFMFEAILHYNLGKNRALNNSHNDKFLPPTNDLIRISILVLVFSTISGFLIKR